MCDKMLHWEEFAKHHHGTKTYQPNQSGDKMHTVSLLALKKCSDFCDLHYHGSHNATIIFLYVL